MCLWGVGGPRPTGTGTENWASAEPQAEEGPLINLFLGSVNEPGVGIFDLQRLADQDFECAAGQSRLVEYQKRGAQLNPPEHITPRNGVCNDERYATSDVRTDIKVKATKKPPSFSCLSSRRSGDSLESRSCPNNGSTPGPGQVLCLGYGRTFWMLWRTVADLFP